MAWLTSQRLSSSVGFTLPEAFTTALERIPDTAWTPAHDDGQVRDGAWVAEVTALLNLTT